MMTDLFNPTFFMFLGILILVVALVVVYFESKSREQNHKIASMLSLVSTLAEDMNGVKMGLHHLSVNRVGVPRFPQQAPPSLEESNMQLFQNNDENLIPVSDDESMDEDSDDSDSDDECESDEDEDEDDDDGLIDEDDDDDDEDGGRTPDAVDVLVADVDEVTILGPV